MRATVMALISDLMIGSRVREALRGAGMTGAFPSSAAAALAGLASAGGDAGAEEGGAAPALLIVDLGDRNLDPLGAIRAAAAKGIPILAFGSHVDEAALAAAREAGASRVVPRSVFASRMAELIAELAGKGAGA